MEILSLLVKNYLTVRQNFLLVIIPSFVASFNNFLFAFLVKELHFFSFFYQKLSFLSMLSLFSCYSFIYFFLLYTCSLVVR